MRLSNSLVSIENPHLKWPFGHSLCPCNPQGRQSNCSFVSIIVESSAKGPNPNEGMVEQKIAVVLAFIAEAMCIGAESFT